MFDNFIPLYYTVYFNRKVGTPPRFRSNPINACISECFFPESPLGHVSLVWPVPCGEVN